MNNKRWLTALLVGSGLILSGCGGGGGGDGITPAATSTLTGTAATGAAIQNGVVTAKCADGSGFTNPVTSDSSGKWTGTLNNASALPCALEVVYDGGKKLHSYATSTGTVNITPLTDLSLALATQQDPATWFAGFSGTPVTNLSAQNSALLSSLAAKGFDIPSTSANPFTTAFNANHAGWDKVLDQLQDAIEAGSGSYQDLVNALKDNGTAGLAANLPQAPTPLYTITGSISGATAAVEWQSQIGSNAPISGSDTNSTGIAFTETGGVETGTSYAITVLTPPSGQTCVVANGSGTINNADVTNVTITCSNEPVTPTTYSIGGTISGATTSQNVVWELWLNGSMNKDNGSPNGSVTFTTAADAGSSYEVKVNSAPSGQTCAVANATGVLANNVTNVAITCEDEVVTPVTHSITGTVSGATSALGWATKIDGSSVNSGTSSNGPVTFASDASGSTYAISVTTPPAGQTCAVSNGSGALTADITNVTITCQDETSSGPTPLYDFSALNLQPVLPTDMTPAAPSVSASDPSSQIASLFAQLGNQEKAAVFAAKPAGTLAQITPYSGYYTVTEYLPDNSWYRQTEMGFGADGEANTSDDVVRAYAIYPHGNLSVGYSFTRPGPDGQWFTSDDVGGAYSSSDSIIFPTTATLLEYDNASESARAVLIIPCLRPGDDNLPYTADDKPCSASVGYQIAVIDGQGNRGEVVSYNNAGADGKWFTADDKVASYTLGTFENGAGAASVTYNNAGTDGQWFTSDDVVQLHTLTKLSDDYKPLYMATYNNKGSDGAWFTTDDEVASWTYYGYDEMGNAVLVATYSNKGSDGQWFTSDDSASALVSLKDDAGHVLIAATLTSPGADGKWLSGDETLSYYAYKLYDAAGHQTHNANFVSAGADGKWFTADDQTDAYNTWQRQYDDQGRMLLNISYNPALATSVDAFNHALVSQYTAYDPDNNNASVYVYRLNGSLAGFGDDQTPFTADDISSYPYQKQMSATLINQYNQPGADGQWFTADDTLAGHIELTLDGDIQTLVKTFDTDGNVTACSQVVDPSANPYRRNNYTGDCDTGTLSGYETVALDSNGNPATTSYYSAADALSYAWITERDSNGKVLRESYDYGTGLTYYSVYTYNGAGQRVSASTQSPGADGLMDTSDDTLTLDAIYLLANSVENLGSANPGYLAQTCADLASSASGDIRLKVRDQNNAPLAGVIAMLDGNGATATTDSNGEATFASLTGNHDVHLFKDGYGWESFYCAVPGNDVTLQGKLVSLSEAANPGSAVYINPSITGKTGYQVDLRLVDASGNLLSAGTRPYSSYTELPFSLPVGAEVSGDLWAFDIDSSGKVLNAVNVGAQTFTTVTRASGPATLPLSISFDTAPTTIPVVKQGKLFAPPTHNNASPTLEVGNGLLVLNPNNYDYSAGGYYAALPDMTLPQSAYQATRLIAGDDSEDYTWRIHQQVNQTLGAGAIFPIGTVQTRIQLEPGIATQDGSGTTPSVNWKPARLLSSNSIASVNTVELAASFGAIGWLPAWTIHTPAGEDHITLPNPPAAITDAVLPQTSYVLRITTQLLPDTTDYTRLVGTQDLHDLGNVSVETIRNSGNFFGSMPRFQR